MLDCDTVVIGSGAGGLGAAVALARAGERVLVLEQHYLPGGWCHSFHLDGFRFSPGVHYIGQLGPNGALRKIYEGLGVAQDLAFFEMNRDQVEHCSLGGERFDLPADKDALSARLEAKFPADAAGIHGYLDLVGKVTDGLSVIPESRGFWDSVRIPYRTRHLARYGLYSLERVLQDRIRDPLARSILGVQCGDHGLPPSRASFGLHAAVQAHYFGGAFYPRGGGAAIPRAMTRALVRHGGALKLKTRVERILIEGRGGARRAIGVRLTDGTELRAGRVISNADPAVTYGRLVDPLELSNGLKKKLAATRWSPAALGLFLAVDLDLKAMGFDSGNYWYCRDADHEKTYQAMMREDALEQPEFPALFFSVTTLKDPSSFDGRHHVVEAFTFAPPQSFAAFGSSSPESRPEAYVALKERLLATFLRTIDRYLPGLSRRVVFKALGTPVTNEHFVTSTQGSAYGTEKSLGQIGPFAFQMRTEIPGLFVCGASTLSHGVLGATRSGLNLAAGLLDCRPAELLTAKGPELSTFLAEEPSSWPESWRGAVARRVTALDAAPLPQ